jgi:hypothetical protein
MPPSRLGEIGRTKAANCGLCVSVAPTERSMATRPIKTHCTALRENHGSIRPASPTTSSDYRINPICDSREARQFSETNRASRFELPNSVKAQGTLALGVERIKSSRAWCRAGDAVLLHCGIPRVENGFRPRRSCRSLTRYRWKWASIVMVRDASVHLVIRTTMPSRI